MGTTQSSLPLQQPVISTQPQSQPVVVQQNPAGVVENIAGSRSASISPLPAASPGMGMVVAGGPGTMNPGAGVGVSSYNYPPVGGSSIGIPMNNMGVGPPVGSFAGPGPVLGPGYVHGSYPQGYMNSTGYLAGGTAAGYGAGYAPGYGGGVPMTGTSYPGYYGGGHGTGYGAGYGATAPQYGVAGQQPSVVIVKNERRHHHHHDGHHHHHHSRPSLRRTRSYDSYYDY